MAIRATYYPPPRAHDATKVEEIGVDARPAGVYLAPSSRDIIDARRVNNGAVVHGGGFLYRDPTHLMRTATTDRYTRAPARLLRSRKSEQFTLA